MSSNKNKILSNSHQMFQNIHRTRSLLKFLFNKVSGLQPTALSKKRIRHRRFPVKSLWTLFLSNTFEQLLLEKPKILLKPVPTAIPNDISKAYYQNVFVTCFLRSAYDRFMDFLIKTYNKGFSSSWIFSAFWAFPNA